MRLRSGGALAVLTILLVIPLPARGQSRITAGWDDGFVLQSEDGDYRLQIGMIAQTDGRFSLDDPPSTTSTFLVRKARPVFTGRVARYFDFKVMPDFGNGQTVIADLYMDVRFSPALRVRTGKDKTPVGYELLVSDAFLLFPERSLASALVPNRDVGVQVLGDLGPRVTYAAGVFNGIPDGTSTSIDVDRNAGKDLAGRVVVYPLRGSARFAGRLNGLGLHLGGSTGSQDGVLPVFRSAAGQTIFAYEPSATADGMRRRVSPAVLYYHRWIGAFVEYARSTQDVASNGVTRPVTNHGWNVSASAVLTGEASSDRGVRPRANFDPARGEWGAVQVAARFSTFGADERVFASGLAAPGSSSSAAAWAIGVNWYPNPWIKWYGTFERTTFDASGTPGRPAEHLAMFRAQIAF